MHPTEPITFAVDPGSRVRRATYRGVVTEPALLSAYERLLSDPGYDPTMSDLVDLRAVERLEVGSECLRMLVDMFARPGATTATRLAIVAPVDYVFGMARMYELLSSDTPEQIHVFRDLDAAERWLGIKGPC